MRVRDFYLHFTFLVCVFLLLFSILLYAYTERILYLIPPISLLSK